MQEFKLHPVYQSHRCDESIYQENRDINGNNQDCTADYINKNADITVTCQITTITKTWIAMFIRTATHHIYLIRAAVAVVVDEVVEGDVFVHAALHEGARLVYFNCEE